MSRASGRCSHRSPLARCSCTMQHSVKTLNSLERDQAVAEKEAIELEYIKLLSLKGEENDIREKAVGDLADKCKYLEIDLETACVAGEAAHGQLLKVAYEKDVIILDLEKTVQKFQEKTKYNEMSQTLKSEIGDLHGMLDAMEHATQDAQLRHANAVEFVKEMDWGMEREKLLEANNRDMADRFAKLTRQNYILKKRLKQSYQVLASITCDCNKLKEQVKAKSMLIKEDKGIVEEALAETAMPVEQRCSKYGHYVERREELEVPTCYESKRKPLHLDMTHLAQRQMKLLDSLVAT